MATITKEKTESKVEEILSKPYRLDLHNDDYNSFDWVITCLMKVCGHEFEQANQCAHIVHFKGKCDVMTDTFNNLKPFRNQLLGRGLTATID